MTRLATCITSALLVALTHTVCPLPVACAAPDSADTIFTQHVRSLRCSEPGTDFDFSPLGVSYGAAGELYIVDSDYSRVFMAPDTLGGMSLFADCPDDVDDCQLIDVEFEPAGGIYVSEKTSGKVITFDRWGGFVADRVVGEGLTGIGRSTSGQIYGAMGISGTIRIVDPSRQSDSLECVIDAESSPYPVDCLVVRGDRVIVTESTSRQVLTLGPLGQAEGRFEGFDFTSPFGLATYLDRYVLVSDSERGLIAIFTIEGRFLSTFGHGILDTPAFIDCRDDGTVCVADQGLMTVEVFEIDFAATE